jgi:hypothetical protein
MFLFSKLESIIWFISYKLKFTLTLMFQNCYQSNSILKTNAITINLNPSYVVNLGLCDINPCKLLDQQSSNEKLIFKVKLGKYDIPLFIK